MGSDGLATVRPFHQGCVQWDDIHEHAQAELLLHESHGDLEFHQLLRRVEEQFNWVVAGLAMDIDGPCEIRRMTIIEPIIIGKPGVRRSGHHEIPRPWMIDAKVRFFLGAEHFLDSRDLLEDFSNGR